MQLEEIRDSLEKFLHFPKECFTIEKNRYNPHLGAIRINHSFNPVFIRLRINSLYNNKGYNITYEDNLIFADNQDTNLIIEFKRNKESIDLSVSRNNLFDFTL